MKKQHNLHLLSKGGNLKSKAQGLSRESLPNPFHVSQNTNLHSEEPFQCIALLAAASSVPNHRTSVLTNVLDPKLILQNQSDQFMEEATIKEKP